MHLDAGAVEAEADHLLAVHFLLLKRREQTLENAALGPAAEPGVDRGPFSEPLRQGPPFASLPKPTRDPSMLNRSDPDCNPPKLNSGETRKRKTGSTKEIGMHPFGGVRLKTLNAFS